MKKLSVKNASSETLNVAIDAEVNLAKPSEFICALNGPPAGVLIVFAEISASIVTSPVILPPSNKNLDAVIFPSGVR